jgi:hypothetical protein
VFVTTLNSSLCGPEAAVDRHGADGDSSEVCCAAWAKSPIRTIEALRSSGVQLICFCDDNIDLEKPYKGDS